MLVFQIKPSSNSVLRSQDVRCLCLQSTLDRRRLMLLLSCGYLLLNAVSKLAESGIYTDATVG